MQNRLEKLYYECVKELETCGINIVNNSSIGEIDIKIAKRNAKRYGCCKHEDPDPDFYYKIKKGRQSIIKCDRFKIHHIEISRWVMDLDDSIIKNTIIHEIIHCLPGCNNHGDGFKKYANFLNNKLGYNISRLGNKKEDYRKSNLEYNDLPIVSKYTIVCQKCGHIYYRQRIKKNFARYYVCSICKGTLKIVRQPKK